MPTKAELEQENKRLRKEVENLRQAKDELRLALLAYADDIGMEDREVNNMLSDLRLPLIPLYRRRWVRINALINWDRQEHDTDDPPVDRVKIFYGDGSFASEYEIEEWDSSWDTDVEEVFD